MKYDYRSFAEFGTPEHVPANMALSANYKAHENKPFFVLVSGACALQTASKKGDELTLFYFREGEMMGHSPLLNNLFQQEGTGDYLYSERDIYVIMAKTDCEVLRFPSSCFQTLLDENVAFRMVLLESMQRHYVSLTGRSSYSANHSAVSTLCTMLARNAVRCGDGRHTLEGQFTYAELARRIGVHQVTVARIMSGLIKEGTLSRKGKHVYVEDDLRLLRYAREEIQLKY